MAPRSSTATIATHIVQRAPALPFKKVAVLGNNKHQEEKDESQLFQAAMDGDADGSMTGSGEVAQQPLSVTLGTTAPPIANPSDAMDD
jgi:hypothetical protein